MLYFYFATKSLDSYYCIRNMNGNKQNCLDKKKKGNSNLYVECTQLWRLLTWILNLEHQNWVHRPTQQDNNEIYD